MIVYVIVAVLYMWVAISLTGRGYNHISISAKDFSAEYGKGWGNVVLIVSMGILLTICLLWPLSLLVTGAYLAARQGVR